MQRLVCRDATGRIFVRIFVWGVYHVRRVWPAMHFLAAVKQSMS